MGGLGVGQVLFWVGASPCLADCARLDGEQVLSQFSVPTERGCGAGAVLGGCLSLPGRLCEVGRGAGAVTVLSPYLTRLSRKRNAQLQLSCN